MAIRRLDLTKQRFGSLVAIDYAGNNKCRGAMWNCQCDCGKLVVVRSASLRSGRTRSCGCGVVSASRSRVNSLEGKDFGRLRVIRRAYRSNNKHTYWECLCSCGEVAVVRADALLEGKTLSCGCFNSDKSTTHGESHTRLFQTYKNMMSRCYDENNVAYKNYGGRGITVCDEWDDFITFKKWAEERGYNDTSVIDKIDNDKGYCPENCRWVGWKESGSNRSNVKMIEFSGEAMHLSAWSEYLGIKRKTLFNRLYKLDWNVEESFTIPVGKSRRNREVVQ